VVGGGLDLRSCFSMFFFNLGSRELRTRFTAANLRVRFATPMFGFDG